MKHANLVFGNGKPWANKSETRSVVAVRFVDRKQDDHRFGIEAVADTGLSVRVVTVWFSKAELQDFLRKALYYMERYPASRQEATDAK
jgi:hypothetical protein